MDADRTDAVAMRTTALRSVLAEAVRMIHIGIVVFFLVGWALPWTSALVAILVAAPIVHAGWWLCADRCILTILEQRLRATEGSKPQSGADENETTFIAGILEPVLGFELSERAVDYIAYGVLWTSFGIAAIRLALRAT